MAFHLHRKRYSQCSQVFAGTMGTHKYSQVLTVLTGAHRCSQVFTGTKGTHKYSQVLTVHGTQYWCGTQEVLKGSRTRHRFLLDLLGPFDVGRAARARDKRERDLVCRARLHRRSQPVALTKPVGIRTIQTKGKVRMTKPCGLPRTPALQPVQRAGRALRGVRFSTSKEGVRWGRGLGHPGVVGTRLHQLLV
jgi:hypothetical protein